MLKKIILKVVRKFDLYKYWVAFREEYYPNSFHKKRREHFTKLLFNPIHCVLILVQIWEIVWRRCLSLKAKVVAIEPQKNCLTFLNKRFKSRAIIIGKGVSSSVGVLKLI